MKAEQREALTADWTVAHSAALKVAHLVVQKADTRAARKVAPTAEDWVVN